MKTNGLCDVCKDDVGRGGLYKKGKKEICVMCLSFPKGVTILA